MVQEKKDQISASAKGLGWAELRASHCIEQPGD